MPAYMIVTARIADRDRFIAGYGAATAPLVARFGGKYVLRGPGAQLLEGAFGDGASMAISEWPDKASALASGTAPSTARRKNCAKAWPIARCC